MDWFLYHKNLRDEKVKAESIHVFLTILNSELGKWL